MTQNMTRENRQGITPLPVFLLPIVFLADISFCQLICATLYDIDRYMQSALL